MIRGLIGVLLLWTSGCVTLTGPRSASQQVTVPDSPQLAYQKATKACQALGAEIKGLDGHQQALSVRLNRATILNVGFVAAPAGTAMTIQATAGVGYILPHDVDTDVTQFLEAYHRQ